MLKPYIVVTVDGVQHSYEALSLADAVNAYYRDISEQDGAPLAVAVYADDAAAPNRAPSSAP